MCFIADVEKAQIDVALRLLTLSGCMKDVDKGVFAGLYRLYDDCQAKRVQATVVLLRCPAFGASGRGPNQSCSKMTRPKIPPETQARILAESRRRCAICFGLHRDLNRKKGQIAHLDRDPNNNAPGNLVFLCMDHHDEYDSTTRQSKGLTEIEVERYRKELVEELERQWAAGQLEALAPPSASSLIINITNVGGAGGPGGTFGGGGGGGGAPLGGGGAGGEAPGRRDPGPEL
jgi:uncharacterized membrane protein YgcG